LKITFQIPHSGIDLSYTEAESRFHRFPYICDLSFPQNSHSTGGLLLNQVITISGSLGSDSAEMESGDWQRVSKVIWLLWKIFFFVAIIM
jgi:hypothetical protein